MQVVEWAWSAPRPFFEMPVTGGTPIPIHGLVIGRMQSGEIYRLSCDAEWESMNDSHWSTVEAARLGESLSFDVHAVDWIAWDEEPEP